MFRTDATQEAAPRRSVWGAWRFLLPLLLAWMPSACSPAATIVEPPKAAATVAAPSVTQEATFPSPPAPTYTPSAAPTATPTRTSTPSPTFEPPTATATVAPTATVIPTEPRPLIAIDAGHGGIDLGAVRVDAQGRLDITESEINLAIALELQKLLLERGYRVLMVRDGDYMLNEDYKDINGSGEGDFVDEVQARVDAINKAEADLVLSIHQNGFYERDGSPAQDVGGTVTFYCADRPFSEENLRFATLVQEHLVAAMHELGHDVHDRGVQDDLVLYVPGEPGSHLILLGPESQRIVRPSQMPGALSEPLFITHRGELALARDAAAQRRLALAYADAIDAYSIEP